MKTQYDPRRRVNNNFPKVFRYLAISLFCFPWQFLSGQDFGKAIDEYISAYANTRDFMGCVRVVKDDAVLFQNCYGSADYHFRIPNSPHTRFVIGSISKQFTAAAILKLEEEGKLSLSDQVDRFFPSDTTAARISVLQLLNHTSGLYDIFDLPGFKDFNNSMLSITELADRILNTGTYFEPGTNYRYSNGGYAVLAAIIEKVSGKKYQDYLKESILLPLDMCDTGHERRDTLVRGLATGYNPLGYDKLRIRDHVDNELLKGSGSLYSTIGDMTKWIKVLKNREFFTPGTYDKFFKDYGNSYGLGISVYTFFDRPVFGHDGRIGGFIADYLHYIPDDISVIILGNVQTGVADFFRRDIAAILFEEPYYVRAKTIPPADKSPIPQDQIQGVYSFGPNFKVYADIMDGSLYVRANEGAYSELIPLSDGRYFNRTLYAYIEFESDSAGNIAKMIWTNNDGNKFEGIRAN